jgi:hypothetical protein
MFFAIAFCLLTSSSWCQLVESRTVSIQLNNITLEEALTILSISYGVTFSYSDDVVPLNERIDLSIQKERLTTVLNKLLRPLNLDYKISNKRILLRKLSIPLVQIIRGSVMDQVSNAPVFGASIVVTSNGQELGVSTDSQGAFKMSSVPIGRISLTISCVGFNTRTFENILLGTGKELVLDIKMEQSITAMNELVITDQKYEAIPGDGVALTSGRSFSVEETKRYAGSMGDPARMATAFAGVTAISDESNALIVRGNSPRGMLWRIGGIEVPNPNHFSTEGASGGVVSVLSSNMIERSDFLTGAFPAQYGNALSGVFDIHLRNGNNQRREHSLQAGFLGLEASTEGPFSSNHESSYLVNYRYSTLSILDKMNFELNDAGQYKDYQDVSFNINYPTSGAGTFSLFGIGGTSYSNKQNGNVLDERASDLGVIALTHHTRIGETTHLNSSLSLSGTEITGNNEISGLSAGEIDVEENYTKSYARFALSAKKRIRSTHVLEGGLIYSKLHFDFYLRNRDPGNVPYQEIVNFSERGDSHILQGYMFVRQHFSPTLFGYYGLHFLNFALTKDQSLEPRIGLRWQPRESASWSVAFGKHSRIENLQYYLGRDHQVGGDEVQINKHLAFTRSHHFVLMYERTFISDHRFKAESYYQYLYNAPIQSNPTVLYSSLNEDTGFITDTLINRGTGKNYGIELSLEKRFPGNYYYLLNTAFYESKFMVKESKQRNTAYNGNYTVHFLAGKEFNIKQGNQLIGINFKLTASGGRPYVPIDLQRSLEAGKTVYHWEVAFEKRLPDYFRTDLQVVYKKNNPGYSFEWRLDIQNFTNHRNALYYFVNTDSQSISLKRQVGFLPLLSCRIDF